MFPMKPSWIVGSIFIFLSFVSPIKAQDKETEKIKPSQRLHKKFFVAEEVSPISPDSSVDALMQFFDTTSDIAVPKITNQCFKFFAIQFEGNSIFSKKKLEKIFVKYLFHCLSIRDIDILTAEITRFYRSRGYSLARVFVDEKSNTLLGELVIEIVEGKIRKIQVNDGIESKNQLHKKTAFPFLEGNVFNIYDIEQGLKQINRLRFSQAKIQVIPIKKKGFNDINISLNKEKHSYLNLNVTDLGNNNPYGKYRYNPSLTVEDIFGLNESIAFSYSRTSKDSEEENLYDRAYSTNFSLPIGYYTISGSYSESAYSQPLITNNQEFISKGNSNSQSLTLNKVLLKKRRKEIALNTNLTIAENKVFIADTLVEVSSKKQTTANISLVGSFILGGGILTPTLSYIEGLPWFNAKEDEPDIRPQDTHLQYALWSSGVSYNINFLKESPVNYSTRLYAQATDREAITQITIGAGSNVRGYRNNGYSDNIGWFQQHTLSVRPLQGISALGSFANAFNFSLYYDYGCVESSFKPKNRRCLSGGGTSLNFFYKGLNLSYSYQIPGSSTKPFVTEEPVVWRMSASFFYGFGF